MYHVKVSRAWLPMALGLLLAAILFLGFAGPVVAQEPTATEVLSASQELTATQALTATAEPTAEPPVYVVQPGDTLYSIAQRFGSTVEAIVAANEIVNPSLIAVGQRLVIPTAEPGRLPQTESGTDTWVHPVQAGETLPFLAFRYGTTIRALQAANDLPRFDLLWPGQSLQIPPASAPHDGMPTWPQVRSAPEPLAQGQTMVLQVRGDASLPGLALSGSFLGQDLWFVEGQDGYWAIAGVDPLTPAGSYALVLEATTAGGGDLWTLHEAVTVTAGEFSTYNVVVPASRTNLLDPELSQAEAAKVNAVLDGFSPAPLWAGTLGLPLAVDELRITAPFGQRRSYNGGPVSSYHSGMDLGADSGTPILAPITGTVVLAEPLQVRGNAVIIDHGLGVFECFWHLSRIDVAVGDTVGKGQVVGLVGNTGLSTGPHLHWELQVRGVPVDPLQWTRQAFP